MPVHFVKIRYPTHRGKMPNGGEMAVIASCRRPMDFAQPMFVEYNDDETEISVIWTSDSGPIPPTSE